MPEASVVRKKIRAAIATEPLQTGAEALIGIKSMRKYYSDNIVEFIQLSEGDLPAITHGWVELINS